MCVLNNLPTHTKTLLLHALNTFPERLLLIIHVIIITYLVDVRYLLLQLFMQNIGDSYHIYTCITQNNNFNNIVPYYSAFCGHTIYDKHNISKHVINYINKIDRDNLKHTAINRDFSDSIIDVDENIYYIDKFTYYPQILIFGKITKSHVILFVCIMIHDKSYDTTELLSRVSNYFRSYEAPIRFHNFARLNSAPNIVMRYNWTLIGNKLC